MDSNPDSVHEDTPIEDVIKLLKENELPGVPVVNDAGRCVGIITENDLVISEEGSDLHLPHYIELFGSVIFLEPLRHFEEKLTKAFASSAKDLMTEDPVTVEPDAPVSKAGHIIASEGHNRLPVVEHGRLVGVVTRVDVLGALAADASA
jgi:CBS domain-containing protein